MAFDDAARRKAKLRRQSHNHYTSRAYQQKVREHYSIPLNMTALRHASRRYGQRLWLGEVVIYNELRPVKVIAGMTEDYVIVQFLDRIDTPIRRVESRKLWSGIPYEDVKSPYEVEMTEIFGEIFTEAEKTQENAFEDGWL